MTLIHDGVLHLNNKIGEAYFFKKMLPLIGQLCQLEYITAPDI